MAHELRGSVLHFVVVKQILRVYKGFAFAELANVLKYHGYASAKGREIICDIVTIVY